MTSRKKVAVAIAAIWVFVFIAAASSTIYRHIDGPRVADMMRENLDLKGAQNALVEQLGETELMVANQALDVRLADDHIAFLVEQSEELATEQGLKDGLTRQRHVQLEFSLEFYRRIVEGAAVQIPQTSSPLSQQPDQQPPEAAQVPHPGVVVEDRKKDQG